MSQREAIQKLFSTSTIRGDALPGLRITYPRGFEKDWTPTSLKACLFLCPGRHGQSSPAPTPPDKSLGKVWSIPGLLRSLFVIKPKARSEKRQGQVAIECEPNRSRQSRAHASSKRREYVFKGRCPAKKQKRSASMFNIREISSRALSQTLFPRKNHSMSVESATKRPQFWRV